MPGFFGGLNRAAQALWTRFQLRGCVRVGDGVSVRGRIWIHGGGEIHLGARVRLEAGGAPIELHAGPGAQIEIGDDVTVLGGTSIEAQKSVVIGPRSRIDAFCKIIDNHFHPVRGDRTQRPDSEQVVLEEEVTLHPRVIVLPGAHLARGATVLSGAVIAKRIPAGVTVGGYTGRPLPARQG